MFQHIRRLQKMYIADIQFGWADSVSFRQAGKLFSPLFQSLCLTEQISCWLLIQIYQIQTPHRYWSLLLHSKEESKLMYIEIQNKFI